jgi:hypothetical protein
MNEDRHIAVFDARYNHNPDDAEIMGMFDNMKDAEEFAADYPGAVIQELEVL